MASMAWDMTGTAADAAEGPQAQLEDGGARLFLFREECWRSRQGKKAAQSRCGPERRRRSRFRSSSHFEEAVTGEVSRRAEGEGLPPPNPFKIHAVIVDDRPGCSGANLGRRLRSRLAATARPLGAEADQLGELTPGFGMVRSDHRIVFLEIPLGAIVAVEALMVPGMTVARNNDTRSRSRFRLRKVPPMRAAPLSKLGGRAKTSLSARKALMVKSPIAV